MKKLFLIFAISGALVACNNAEETTTSADSATTTTVVTTPDTTATGGIETTAVFNAKGCLKNPRDCHIELVEIYNRRQTNLFNISINSI